MLVGVDIGGTFTDLVLSVNGKLEIYKLPSTPSNPAIAMQDGLQKITNGNLKQLKRVIHGSTIATNAILERKGAKTAFITSEGFRDLLFIGRQNRPQLYALKPELPEPLIPHHLCYEIPERLDHTGKVITELDIDVLNRVLDEIDAQGCESIAVCFLYSYLDAEHERMVQGRIYQRQLLERWKVALSSDILPEFREYERASTVALEAYVRPIMGRYISQIKDELPEDVSLMVMKSDGGMISALRVKEQAIQTALSGPAAGVIGASHIAQLAGFSHIITLDMGGTSTDVSICPGDLIRRPQSQLDGLPLRVRLLDIETIGAGGGSIARIDSGGALRVGPESAGANPGPACYRRGGLHATVSDANVVLGRLDVDHFLDGNMSLDIVAALDAVQDIADTMGVDVETAAKGVIEVTNANIDRALRRVSVARGYDPRDFVLVAFGGAGGLHACEVADRLEIPRVLIPPNPGVLCAFGLLIADVVMDYSQAILEIVDDHTIVKLMEVVEEMIIRARDDLRNEGIERANRRYHLSLDVRYQGQAHELNISVDATADIRAMFHEAHYAAYGHSIPERPVEVVNLRLQAIGIVEHPVLTPIPSVEDDEFAGARFIVPGDAVIGEKKLKDGTKLTLYNRAALPTDARFEGPALIFQQDSTIFIPNSWSAQVDTYHNLILDKIRA